MWFTYLLLLLSTIQLGTYTNRQIHYYLMIYSHESMIICKYDMIVQVVIKDFPSLCVPIFTNKVIIKLWLSMSSDQMLSLALLNIRVRC